MEPTKTASAGRLLRRSQAARMLGVSVSTLRRREGDVLNPIVGANGVHLFDEAEVRAVTVTMRARSAMTAMGASAGDTAADVFTLLDDGVHPVEIVKRLRLTPEIVIALQEQWTRMRGGLSVSATEVIELGRIARGPRPTTATALVNQVRARVEALTRMRQGSATCAVCRDKTASICQPCVVATRGPLGCLSVRTEERSTDAGDEIRIAAEVHWDDGSEDSDGDVATLYSEWFTTSCVGEAPIVDIVSAVRRARG